MGGPSTDWRAGLSPFCQTEASRMACNRVRERPARKSRRMLSRTSELQLSLLEPERLTKPPAEELFAELEQRLQMERAPVTEGMVPFLLWAKIDPLSGTYIALPHPLVREFTCSGDLEEDSLLQCYP